MTYSGRENWDGITDSIDMSLRRLQKMVKDREAWHAAVHGVVKRRTQLRTEQVSKKDACGHQQIFVEMTYVDSKYIRFMSLFLGWEKQTLDLADGNPEQCHVQYLLYMTLLRKQGKPLE